MTDEIESAGPRSPDRDPRVSKLRPRWRRILRRVVIVAAVLGGVFLLAELILGYVAARRLRGEIAAIRAAGEPVTLAELNANLPEIDPAADAAGYYAAGLALVGRLQDNALSDYCAYYEAYTQDPTSRPSRGTVDAIAARLEELQDVLELLDKGAGCPECRFDLSAGTDMGACINRVGQARSAAQLLSMRTWHLASAGDGDAAVDSVISALRMTRIFDHQPVLIAYLVKAAVRALACQDAAGVLELTRPSAAALVRLQQALLSAERADEMTRVLLAERALGLQIMGDFFDGRIPSPLAGEQCLPSRPRLSGFIHRWMLADYLRRLAELVEASRKPWTEKLHALSECPPTRAWGLAKLIEVPWRRAVVLLARGLGQSRSTAVAVMIERYRRAHGKLPESLGELTPAFAESLPVDPFSGKGLLYRPGPDGYVVYGVGDNRRDDGGRLEAENGERPDDGVRIRLPATSRPAAGASEAGAR